MTRKAIDQTARREFAKQLDDHLKRGQRPDVLQNRWKPWTNEDFAGATGASPNSVANWRNQVAPIPPRDIRPLLGALFEDKPEFAGHCRTLREAWERAQGLVPPELREEDEGGWELKDVYKPTGLAAVTLHQPTPANIRETWRLNASIRFGAVEIADDQERIAVVTLTEASAVIEGEGYQVAQNSLIGERAPNDYCMPNGEEIHFIGPVKEGADHLSGNPLGEDHIATIEPGPEAKESGVGVTLAASPRTLRFAFAADPGSPPVPHDEKPNRAAILGLLFAHSIRKDAQGRVVLARAKLRRKAE